jgi:hypothetical protein
MAPGYVYAAILRLGVCIDAQADCPIETNAQAWPEIDEDGACRVPEKTY